MEGFQSPVVPGIDASNASRAVLVANISASASNQNVYDFFSFCGKVDNVMLAVDPNAEAGLQHAVVLFADENASATALLLSNAQIIDSAILVFPYSPPAAAPSAPPADAAPSSSSSPLAALGIQAKAPPAAVLSATATIASLFAAGYIKGEHITADMKAKAMELDAKHNVKSKMEFALSKAKEVNEQYGITSRAKAVANSALEKGKEINEKYQIEAKAKEVAEKAMENEMVKKGVGMLQQGAGMLVGTFNFLASQTKAEIASQKGSAPAAAAAPAHAEKND